MASFSVVNNIGSTNAQAKLYATNNGLQKTLSRLSSGLRINNSGDDAAGLAVANAYRSDTAVLNQGVRNANDGLSTLQIADGALDNISNLLDRASTLASQAASGTFTGSRTTLNNEFAQVLTEINREATAAGLTTGLTSSVFISNESSAGAGTVGISFGAVTTTSLGIDSSNISTETAAASAVVALSAAVMSLGLVQGDVGAAENRLNYAITLAQSEITNKTSAESRIRDANMAEESTNLTRYNILTQSGLAALAQANSSNQSVLSLLQ